MNFFLHLIATLLIFLTLDVVWLKVIIGDMVDWPWVVRYGYPVNWAWAELYYLAMAVRLTFGSAYKSMVMNDAAPAFSEGASMGFWFSVLYALVNTALFHPWPIELIVLDVAWNTFAWAATAVAGYAVGNWLTGNNSQVRRT